MPQKKKNEIDHRGQITPHTQTFKRPGEKQLLVLAASTVFHCFQVEDQEQGEA